MMYHPPDPAVAGIIRECCSPLYQASAPEELFNRIVGVQMEAGSGYKHITLSAYDFFVPQELIATTMAKPGKKKTYDVIPQIVQVIHAAGRIVPVKL
jgi:hypothetical protein